MIHPKPARSLASKIGLVSAANVVGAAANFFALAWFARTLGAATFGEFAQLVIAVEIIGAIFSFGLNQGVIRDPENDALFAAAWYGSLAQSGMLAGGAYCFFLVAAPGISAHALSALVVSRALGLFGYLLIAPLEARLDYAFVTWVRLASLLSGLAVGVLCVVTGLGIWSLLWREVVIAIVSLVMSALRCPRWPAGRPTRAVMRTLLRYNSPLWGLNLLERLALRVDYAMVGMVLGTESLGVYFAVRGLVEGVLGLLVNPVQTVLFAFYCRTQAAIPWARRQLRRLAVPVLIAVAALAAGVYWTSLGERLVALALGDAYAPGGEIIPGLILYGAAILWFENTKVIALAGGSHAKMVLARAVQVALLAATTVPLAVRFAYLGAGLATGVSAVLLAVVSTTLLFTTRSVARESEPTLTEPAQEGSRIMHRP